MCKLLISILVAFFSLQLRSPKDGFAKSNGVHIYHRLFGEGTLYQSFLLRIVLPLTGAGLGFHFKDSK